MARTSKRIKPDKKVNEPTLFRAAIYTRVSVGEKVSGGTVESQELMGIAKNYLNESELSRLNRLVTMFIDYAELMAEDGILMSMQDWLDQTNQFLTNNRRKVLSGKGHSHMRMRGKRPKRNMRNSEYVRIRNIFRSLIGKWHST